MGRTSGLPCSARWRACGSGRAWRSWCADVAVPQQLLERADVVAVLEGMRRERVAECGGLARLGRHPCQTAACLSARRRTVSCRWWRWHCPVTQSRWVPGRLDSPSTAYTADRGRAMSTYSLSCGRGPTIACGGRSGKERPRLYGRRDTGLGRRPGGAAPHGRAKLSRGPWVPPVGATKALSGRTVRLGRYLELEVE